MRLGENVGRACAEWRPARHPVPAQGPAQGHLLGAGKINAALNLELDADPKNSRDVTAAEYATVYRLADARVQIAMDLVSNIGQRRGDILAIRALEHLTNEGVLVVQGKTQTAVLVEWTPALHGIINRTLALPPDIPKDFVLRTRHGRPYTADGFNGTRDPDALQSGTSGPPHETGVDTRESKLSTIPR
jgi:hypothetical protein